MDLFRRAAQQLQTSRPVASIENPQVPISSAGLLELVTGWAKSGSGQNVTAQNALGLSAVWRSVNLISSTCAGLPLHVYRDDPQLDVRVKVSGGWGADLLANPHPDLTPFELWELVYVSLCLYGNAYLLKLKNGLGVVSELWWVAPDRIRVGRDPVSAAKFYILDGKDDQPLSDERVLHIPGFGYDGICGVSPIRAAREGLGLAMAAEEYGARFFGNGSLATGLLQSEQRIDQPEATRLKELWRAGGNGLDSAHDIRVMGSGAKFTQLSIPNDDAQFLETREYQVTDVARWFGIPPHLLMQTEKSTSWGTGIETQNLGLTQFTLLGYLSRVEQRLTKMITPGPLYARYNLQGFLRGAPKDRADFYTKMWGMGAFSTNDILRLEDMPPVKGGDARYVPLNYGLLGAPPAPAPAPALPATEQEST